MTKIDVYQGNQIGGCITVITASKGSETHRIMIDYGESLPGNEDAGFQYPWEEKPVDAVFFTHYHTIICSLQKNVHKKRALNNIVLYRTLLQINYIHLMESTSLLLISMKRKTNL